MNMLKTHIKFVIILYLIQVGKSHKGTIQDELVDMFVI